MSKRDKIIEIGKSSIRAILMTALTIILAMYIMTLSNGMDIQMIKWLVIVLIDLVKYATILTILVISIWYIEFIFDYIKTLSLN